MKKLSKIGLLILAFALICAGIVMSVSGAETNDGKVSYVDAAGNTKEGTLDEAWQNAASDSVITLLGHYEMEEKLVLNKKNLTVDIGGYTLISTDNSAFELGAGTSLTIKGSGTILLDGMLANSSATGVAFTIEGDAGTKGIDIIHNGFSNNRIVYADYGVWNFKNIDVVSDADGKNWHCFFEMRNVSASDVIFTFDTVNFEYATPYISHPGQFITNVSGTGHLTVKNSTFKTEHSAIKSGLANNLGKEVMLIENSVIIAETNKTSIKDVSSARNYAILGMDDKFSGSPKGILNIYNSLLSANYRTICYENIGSEDFSENVANIYDSTIKVTGLNGNDTSENISRAIMLNSYGNTAFINRKYAVAGASNDIQPYLIAEAGFRTNLLGFTTNKKLGEGVRVVEEKKETKDPVTGEVTDIEYVYKYACESEKYTWVYDPVGNPDAPYVLVKNEDAKGYADAYKFAGFETYQFSSKSLYEYTEYMIYRNGEKISDWNSYEPFGQTRGSGNPDTGDADTKSKNKMEGFHWAQRGGTYLIAGDSTNKYMKYWVEPSASDPEAENVELWLEDGKAANTPFWIIGEMVPGSATDMKYVRTMVNGENRKSVMVVDIDFGSENGVYPNFYLKMTSRYQEGSKYDNSAQINTNWFEIKNGGEVTNNLGTAGTDLETVPTPVLNGANVWNHLSVVFYTDTMYEGGLAYVYLNGELMGTQAFYTEAKDVLYLQGIRFDINKDQIANSTLCIDNMSLRCYTNYQVEGEADGAEKSPEHYMIASAPGHFINSALAVAGNTYRGADVEELQKKADELGTVIRLKNDFTGKVATDANICTNGYQLNPVEGSYAADVIFDKNSGNYTYKFNKAYNDLKVVYYWYVGEYGNADQMKNPENYLITEVVPGQTPIYPGEAIPPVKDNESMAQKLHFGWHSAGDDYTVDELVPVTVSAAISYAGKPVYMYPSYYDAVPTAYVINADGEVVNIATSAREASELLGKLQPGDTFVVCEDFQLDDEYLNNYFTADTEAPAKMALDLNGCTIYVGSATARGSLILVDSNVTFSVYSSVPGGMIASVQGEEGDYGIKGLAILGIFNGKEEAKASLDTSNAHLQVGTVEVDGEIIPGSNLTLYGCVLVEGITGDDSCSIEVDGIRAICHSDTEKGAFATRFYSGSFHVNNTVVLAPTVSSVIVLNKIGDRKNVMTPDMLVENTVIVNNGDGIVGRSGDEEKEVCLTLKNIVTNGTIAVNGNGRKDGLVAVDTGVFATAIDPDKDSRIIYVDGVCSANYNQPMTLAGITDEDMYEVVIPAETGTSAAPGNDIDYFSKYVYIVESVNKNLVPSGSINEALVLPILKVGTGTEEELLQAVFMGFDGKVASTENVIKGGIPAVPAISDCKISDFTTLVFTGEFDKEVTAITESTTYTPIYNVVNGVTDVKTNVSFYTNFNVNIYLPYNCKDYLTDATVNGVAITITVDEVDGVKYVMCSAPISADKFADDLTFVLTFNDEYNGVIYSGTASITTSVISYAESILANENGEYTTAEMDLVYAAVNYANESIIFARGIADADVKDLLAKYVSDTTKTTGNVCDGYITETNLADAFFKVNVRLGSAPAFVFTMKRDFVGTVTFTIGGTDFEYDVRGNNERTIVLEDLTIAEFTSDILITVDGKIGNTDVVVDDGAYNLATYAKYHVENSAVNVNMIPTDSQLTSKKAVAVMNAMYVYAAAAKAFVAD